METPWSENPRCKGGLLYSWASVPGPSESPFLLRFSCMSVGFSVLFLPQIYLMDSVFLFWETSRSARVNFHRQIEFSSRKVNDLNLEESNLALIIFVPS